VVVEDGVEVALAGGSGVYVPDEQTLLPSIAPMNSNR
jgi:hypothetical protein